MPTDLVIFDNDGVLVDSERLANGILARLLTEAGLPTTAEESIVTYLGSTMDRVRELAEAALGAALPADLFDRYHDELFERMAAELVPVPGIATVLDALDGRARCVASSGTPERIRRSLTLTGLIDRFDDGALFSASEVERGKPAPDLFLHAASTMDVRPERCVVVEDSPAGVEAAKAAGMTVIGFAALTPLERLADADEVVVDAAALHVTLSSSRTR
ncbi:MAG: HAD family hydrolase [Actinomycetota bacterium]